MRYRARALLSRLWGEFRTRKRRRGLAHFLQRVTNAVRPSGQANDSRDLERRRKKQERKLHKEPDSPQKSPYGEGADRLPRAVTCFRLVRRLTSSPQHAGASTAAPRATGDSHAERRRSTWSSSETEQSSVAAAGYPERAKNPRAAAGCFKCADGAPPLSQGLSRMCAGTLRSGLVMRRLPTPRPAPGLAPPSIVSCGQQRRRRAHAHMCKNMQV